MIEAKERFLLYIDFLGFSEMVKLKTSKVRELFNIINQLNVHYHDAFQTIVFSDTILVYNKDYALRDSDKEYYIMFLIEFVEDLFYKVAGKELFFRALIVSGDFSYEQTTHFQQYYGNALLKAYQAEKVIKASGLFIESSINKYNKVFHTRLIPKDFIQLKNGEKGIPSFRYVYINQSLDFYMSEANVYPIPRALIEGTDMDIDIIKDCLFLKDINKTRNLTQNKNVKLIMDNTFLMYEKQFKNFISCLTENNFVIKNIIKIKNCNKIIRNTQSYKNGKFLNITNEEIVSIMQDAKNIGIKAATDCITNTTNLSSYPCGWSHIIIDLDNRCKFVKQVNNLYRLKKIDCEISKINKKTIITFYNIHNNQELIVDKSAANAIADYLKEKLDLIIELVDIID